MKKIAIANVMLGCDLGGIEQAALDYAEVLKLAGYDVYTIIHPQAAVRKALEAAKMPFVTLSNLGAWDVLAVQKLRGILKKHNIDVCIAHGNRALSLLRRAVIKQTLIAVTHNYKIKLKDIHAVFCPTQDLIRHAEHEGITKSDIFHIPNMVHVLPPITAERGRNNPPVIGSMGRFVAKKGFDVFIEALAILKSDGVAFRAELAGSGKEEHKLKSLAQKLGLNRELSFLGWIDNKRAFFNTVDVFCLPSHHEPFGIVLLEAMAQEIPVVTTASEGPSEIISDGINGLIVEKANSIKLAKALQLLINEPVTSRKLAKNAYDTVYDNYDISVISKKLEHAINSLVNAA